MNLPASTSGNWNWRYAADALSPDISARLRELTELYGRDSATESKTQKSDS